MTTHDHMRYVWRVLNGDFPKEILVPLDEPFVNENGEIQNLVLGEFASSALIYSKAKTVRANHRHKTDWHFAYLVSGVIWYYSRKNGERSMLEILPGEMFFTPPGVDHAMGFPVESTFITFSKNLRDHDSHESDVERVEFITKDIFRGL